MTNLFAPEPPDAPTLDEANTVRQTWPMPGGGWITIEVRSVGALKPRLWAALEPVIASAEAFAAKLQADLEEPDDF